MSQVANFRRKELKMASTPDCKDFILTAVRETRANLRKVETGPKSGVSITRIWSLARNFYSEEDFRQGLNQLHSEGVLLIIWDIGRGVEGQNYHIHHEEIMEQIPPAMPLDNEWWYKEVSGNSLIPYADIIRTPAWEYDRIHAVKLYIRADSLPQKIFRLLDTERNDHSLKRARQIMAKCNEQT